MTKLKRAKDITVGAVLGGMLFSGVSYAATATSINVNFLPLKYFFDGVEKKAPQDQQGFVYQGTTYVPLRFAAEALGKKVGYDGPTSSIYVGKQKEGTVTYLEEMKTHTSDNDGASKITSFISNTGAQFNHGYYVIGNTFGGTDGAYGYGLGNYLINTYMLNGNYKSFEAFIAPSSKWNDKAKSENVGNVKIYADDKLVYTSGAIASDITGPIPVQVDLTGVLNLRIELLQNEANSELGLLDAKLIQ